MAYLSNILLTFLVTTLITTTVRTNDVKPPKGTNPEALLKHLTPIAGTNLFLNTPYKWHDRTKPGCYATWFTETYKDWSGEHKGIRMVCNKHDQQWYNTPDASWMFERTDGSESIDEYDGTVKIKNLGAEATLETWKSSDVWWVGLGTYAGKAEEDMWHVRGDSANRNFLQLEIQKWFLDQRPAPFHQTYVALKKDETAGYPYSFVPVIELEANMNDFVFVRPVDKVIADHSSKKGLIDSYDINNGSPASTSRTITVSEKVTNEFAWGFPESLKTFAKVKGKVGIPFVAESEVEAGFEMTYSANQNWKNSVEKSFQMSYQVNVPPKTKVRVSAWYDLIKGLSLDYTALTEITGSTTRITVFNDLVKDSPATGEMIRSQLDYSKFDGTIVEVKEFSVIAQIKGTMVASVGVRGQLDIDGNVVSDQIVPN